MMQKLIHGGDVYSFQPKADFSANIESPWGAGRCPCGSAGMWKANWLNYPDTALQSSEKGSGRERAGERGTADLWKRSGRADFFPGVGL